MNIKIYKNVLKALSLAVRLRAYFDIKNHITLKELSKYWKHFK